MKPDLINNQRMQNTFLELAKIPSVSKKEGRVAKYLLKELKKLGGRVFMDNADKKFQGEAGNIIAKFPGTKKSSPFLLCSHTDTVTDTKGIKIKVTENKICTDGKTILGADDKAGIALILEILKVLKENKLNHPPLEIVFTVSEEIGSLGSKYLDYSKIKSKYGLVLDTKRIDSLTVKAPAIYHFIAKIYGRSAHAGIEPERGISAIKIASEALYKLKFARLDNETTSNIGIISGGTATNIVAPEVMIKGEIRSLRIEKIKKYLSYVQKVLKGTVKKYSAKVDGRKISAKMTFKIFEILPKPLSIPENSKIVKLVKKSAESEKVKLKPIAWAPCDSSYFFYNGIYAPNFGFGASDYHTPREYLILKDYYKSARIVLGAVLGFAE